MHVQSKNKGETSDQRIARLKSFLLEDHSKLPVELFDTKTDRGLGVRATEKIAAGQPLFEFGYRSLIQGRVNIDAVLEERYVFSFYLPTKSRELALDPGPDYETHFQKDPFRGLAHFVNHSLRNANIEPHRISLAGDHHIVFMATRDIAIGDELLYDYGEREEEQVQSNPWLLS
jgi:hypothetical protein